MRLSRYVLILLLFANHCTVYEVDDKCIIEEYSNEGSYERHRCYR